MRTRKHRTRRYLVSVRDRSPIVTQLALVVESADSQTAARAAEFLAERDHGGFFEAVDVRRALLPTRVDLVA